MGDRPVSTDALETLGNIIGPNEKRDAIHIAVEPTVARERLIPGAHVGVDGTTRDPVGIVDPFLTKAVEPGQTFWLLVYPRKITSLRHVWSHPLFDDTADIKEITQLGPSKEDSEKWIREFIATSDCPEYEILMASIDSGWTGGSTSDYYDDYITGRNDGESVHFNGTDAHGEIPPLFWIHAENVLGKRLAHAKWFSCSC